VAARPSTNPLLKIVAPAKSKVAITTCHWSSLIGTLVPAPPVAEAAIWRAWPDDSRNRFWRPAVVPPLMRYRAPVVTAEDMRTTKM
jgi:hypothetical protein